MASRSGAHADKRVGVARPSFAYGADAVPGALAAAVLFAAPREAVDEVVVFAA